MHNKDFYIKGTIEILKFVSICNVKELDVKKAEYKLDEILGPYNIFTFTDMLDKTVNDESIFEDASTFLNDGTECEKFFLDILKNIALKMDLKSLMLKRLVLQGTIT